MKTITTLSMLLAITILTSCLGEKGIPGQDGLDGVSFLGSVFEIEGDFRSSNDYTLYFDFPKTVEVFESDVVLVYILWEQVANNTGNATDVWRLLPQTVILNEGLLQYNFDYTWLDVKIFLTGTIDMGTLRPAEALNQIFRIVVFPAAFAKNNVIDIYDYNLMMKSLQFNPDNVMKINLDEIEKLP